MKRKYGKNVRRDDGPAWREAQADKEAKGEENDVAEDEAGFFEHQGGDEFAYTPTSDDSESRDENLGSMNDDGGDAIPEFFSTSDDDLRHDSYAARGEEPEEASLPTETEARENSDNRQNQNNWNRSNQQNNRNQNNRWQPNNQPQQQSE